MTYHLHPLTAIEQEDAFQLSESLRLGHLPARFSEQDPNKYLKDYVQTYVREEVLQESLTRNIGHFSRFLEAASFSQGSVTNTSEIAREAHIERASAENYFSIIEDLLMGVRLPVFTRKAKRKLIRHQKFYYFDTAYSGQYGRPVRWSQRPNWTVRPWKHWSFRSCVPLTITWNSAINSISGGQRTVWKLILFYTVPAG